MSYFKLFKFNFLSPIRIGVPSSTGLDAVTPFLRADTIFSAFCHALLDTEGKEFLENYLSECAKQAKFLISDMLPCFNDEIYLPKPYMQVKMKDDTLMDHSSKKKFKSLKYLSTKSLIKYLHGEQINIDEEAKVNESITNFITFKASIFRTKSSSQKLENELFVVNSIRYKNENLNPCLIVQCNNEKELNIFYDALNYVSKSHVGLGGKRSIGYGQFSFEAKDIQDDLKDPLSNENSTKQILLSASRPSKEEMKDVLNGQNGISYQITERRGFISSPLFKGPPIKKKTCFLFDSGSIFQKRFCGELIDITPEDFSHKVYRYGYAMFAGVSW